MSRRATLIQLALVVQTIAALAGIALTLGPALLLDPSPDLRPAAYVGTLLVVEAGAVLVAGALGWRLAPVLRVLGCRDGDTAPPPQVMQTAQARAAVVPVQLLAGMTLVALAAGGVRVWLGRDSLLGVTAGALTVTTVPLAGWALSAALRGVLRRLSLGPAPGGLWTSVIVQGALQATVLGLVLLSCSGAFGYALSAQAAAQAMAEERARWLGQVVVPAVRALPLEERLAAASAALAQGEAPFLLDATGRVQGTLPYGLVWAQVRDLAGVTTVRLAAHRTPVHDTVRVLALPLGADDDVLCVAYPARGSPSPAAARSLRVLAGLSAGGLLFAVLAGASTGAAWIRPIRTLADQVRALVRAAPGRDPPRAHSVTDQLAAALAELQDRFDEHAARLGEAQARATAADQGRAQGDALAAALVAPVIPVSEGVIAVPLVGAYDEARAQQIRPSLLAGVTAQRARWAVIDLSGVSEATEPLLANLARAAGAAALMGCQVVLTGIGPRLAATLPRGETGLANLPAYRNLAAGLMHTAGPLPGRRPDGR